jgi:Protein of unknown function (DUF559)
MPQRTRPSTSTSTSTRPSTRLRPGVPEPAAWQGGVFTSAQAQAEGWSLRQIRRRIERTQWVYVAGRGLALPQESWTPFQLAVAAQLTVPSAVTSHFTAGLLHGWPLLPLIPAALRLAGRGSTASHVITRAVHRCPRNIVAHRISLRADDAISLDGAVMVTTAQRTAVDCLALLPPSAALDLWAWVRPRAVITESQLAHAITERTNWQGTGRLRDLLAMVADGAVSHAEQECHRLLRQAGITGWEAGITLCDSAGVIGVVDILFRAERLVIEIDGFRAHSSQTTFINDRRRQNRLIAAGYRVLRFTWADLRDRPADVLAQIRNAL